jgi:hypothetical protein
VQFYSIELFIGKNPFAKFLVAEAVRLNEILGNASRAVRRSRMRKSACHRSRRAMAAPLRRRSTFDRREKKITRLENDPFFLCYLINARSRCP